MVVIFLFIGSFRSVLIPVVAIPLSLVGGVFLMQVFGFTVNLLTLLAIVLSSGWWSTTPSWCWKTWSAISGKERCPWRPP